MGLVREPKGVDFVISFDRKGYDSVITFQSSGRTCSDKFAQDLAGLLNLEMQPDPTGSYTDSNEFAYDVSECTNLSVGYFAQHTSKESQDLAFLEKLAVRLIRADWQSLRAYRDPMAIDVRPGKSNWRDTWADYYDSPKLTLHEICRDYPTHLADWLDQNGIDPDDLAIELGIDNPGRYDAARDWR